MSELEDAETLSRKVPYNSPSGCGKADERPPLESLVKSVGLRLVHAPQDVRTSYDEKSDDCPTSTSHTTGTLCARLTGRLTWRCKSSLVASRVQLSGSLPAVTNVVSVTMSVTSNTARSSLYGVLNRRDQR